MGTATYKPIRATYDAQIQDTVSVEIDYEHDTDVTNPIQIIDVINAAEAAVGIRVPKRMERFGTTGLFARDFTVQQHEARKRRFTFGVTYSRPNGLGPELAAVANLHPTLHPATIGVQYIEREFVIEKATNDTGWSGGAARLKGGLGPVTNTAGVETQSPLVDVDRIPVLVIRKNVASLATVLTRNRDYQRTTNNAAITVAGMSFPKRTLKFQGTDAGDEQRLDDVSYWETETRIEIHSTTDRTVNSVGVQYVDEDGELQPIRDKNGDQIIEPIPIGLDGLPGTPGTNVEIVYYYLAEKNYSPLFV
jgi:hypothetical protein